VARSSKDRAWGRVGVPVAVGVEVIVGVSVMLGLAVIVGVSVMVGVSVIVIVGVTDAVGGTMTYIAWRPKIPESKAAAPSPRPISTHFQPLEIRSLLSRK
jgi:hypothetical protein